ncbi:MAG: hypothetical protein QCI00_09585 [Candidatus Thermoplasmatota archaeon]|nr:hypothetical protein [Candidatus Thermoplasmatota archaeon]
MKQDFWKKGMVFGIIFLFLAVVIAPGIIGDGGNIVKRDDGGSDGTVTICLKRYDPDIKKVIDDPVGTISLEKAQILTEQLSDIWMKELSIQEKIKVSLNLFNDSEMTQFTPIKNVIESYNAMTISQYPEGDITNTNYIFNLLSLWGMFCFGQSTLIGFFAPIYDSFEYIIQEYPAGDGYNMSLFAEYGILGLVVPIMGTGFFGTAGAFGVRTIQNPLFTKPTAFIGLLGFTFLLGISFKFGSPGLSLAELYLGFAVFPLIFPL